MKPLSILALLLLLVSSALGILETPGSLELGLAAVTAGILSLHDRK